MDFKIVQKIMQNATAEGIQINHDYAKIQMLYPENAFTIYGMYLQPGGWDSKKLGVTQEMIILNPKQIRMGLDFPFFTYVLLHELAHATGYSTRCNRLFFLKQPKKGAHQEEYIADGIALEVLNYFKFNNLEVLWELRSHQIRELGQCELTPQMGFEISKGFNYFLEHWIKPSQQSEKIAA